VRSFTRVAKLGQYDLSSIARVAHGRQAGNIPTTAEGEPTPKAQRNFTDPESRIMKSGDGHVQAYNCRNCGEKPAKLVADAGYFSETNVCETMKWGIDPYITSQRAGAVTMSR
jgi:hypothetical protein